MASPFRLFSLNSLVPFDSLVQCKSAVADPDPELRGGRGGGGHLLALLTFLPSVISFIFTQNKGNPGAPGSLP